MTLRVHVCHAQLPLLTHAHARRRLRRSGGERVIGENGANLDPGEQLDQEGLRGRRSRHRDYGHATLAPLLVNASGAGHLLGVSERSWRRLDQAGLVPTAIKVGRQWRWSVAELACWVAAGCPPRLRWERPRSKQETSHAD